MADVDDRGQLLLVGALTLAVMLVALAVLLNAAIYTGNVATRDAGPGTGEAIEYENEATSMAQATINALNEREDESYHDLRQNFTDTVDVWSDTSRAHSAASLADARVETVSIEAGTLIRQDMYRNFTGDGGEEGWTVGDDTEARGFELNVSRDSLAELDEGEGYVFSESFRVRFNDDDGARTVQVYTREESDDVWVGVGGTGASPMGECSADPGTDGRILVDISGGTVGDESCEPLEEMFDSLSTPYDVRIENGDLASGTHSVVVDRDVDEVSTTTDEDADGPHASAILYSADVELTYRTTDMYYQTEFTVAPGETDD